MRKYIILIPLLILIFNLLVISQEHKYIGDTKCKMCHSKQFKSWETTPHAKAWAALKPEEQKKDECAICHSTGYKKSEELLTNVQCEACHGPGSDYKDIKIMKNKEKAIAAGLIIPTEETCKTCHNEKSPNYKGFNFDEYSKKGVHEHFKK